jgi:fructokinase
MKNKVVIGLGEVLWDVYPDVALFGGAPANFALHASYLGADAHIISAVGNDPLGTQALEWLFSKNQPTNHILVDPKHPTGNVQITLDRSGSPSYHFAPNVAWDYLTFPDEAFDLASKADAICFGTLAQRSKISAQSITKLLDSTPKHCLRVFDVNLRQDFYSAEVLDAALQRANILKLNREELPIVLQTLNITPAQSSPSILEHQAQLHQSNCQYLIDRYNLHTVALTLGSDGSMIYNTGRWDIQPGLPVDAIDTVGAGDSFSAALIMGLLHGKDLYGIEPSAEDLSKIHQRAARIAAYVCTQRGAVPLPPEDLLR